MSIFSTLYFSSRNISELQDLEQDNEALVADFSSRGIRHPTLMDEEFDLILPKSFSKYKENILSEGEEEQLVLLSSEFISDGANLNLDDLKKANDKINQNFINQDLKGINKLDIDDLPRRTRIIAGILLACSLVSYFQYGKILISLFFAIILIVYYFYSFKSYKIKRERQVKNSETNFIPQLKELVSVCKEAKERNLSAYYHWSL